jgi:hypothetical protein
MQRFLVGSQDTSHLKIIPVLGYSNKCVISAMTSRGGNRGGNRATRGVFPSAASSPVPIASNAKPVGRTCGLFQLQSAPRLTGRALRAALFAARSDVTPSARRSIAVPWRERPRDLTGSAITPAATAEVAHATLSLSQPELPISTVRSARSADALRVRVVFSSAVGGDCAVRDRALKARRVASPAHARGCRP